MIHGSGEVAEKRKDGGALKKPEASRGYRAAFIAGVGRETKGCIVDRATENPAGPERGRGS